MLNWENRNKEISYLFNPSFCGLLIGLSANAYYKSSNKKLPLILAYLILPLVLKQNIRKCLPRSIATSVLSWIDNFSELKFSHFENIKNLKPIVNESLLFGLRSGILKYEDSCIVSNIEIKGTLKKYYNRSNEEIKECMHAAEFIGRWFGLLGMPSLLLSLFGVKP